MSSRTSGAPGADPLERSGALRLDQQQYDLGVDFLDAVLDVSDDRELSVGLLAMNFVTATRMLPNRAAWRTR
jgi:hypothetical protein